jgi:tricorn protease
LTATPAVESDPHFSPDGRWLAFTSTRDGTRAVYVMPGRGRRADASDMVSGARYVRGWTPDGARILYASSRESAPTSHDRLWTVSRDGGPSTMLPAPWGSRGSYSADGRRMVVDRVDRWDVEWRNYRGGQNTPLTILDLEDLGEVLLPNEDRTTDIAPVWLDDTIYFLSDRDRAMNVWAYDVASRALRQVTRFTDADVKSLAGRGRHARVRAGRLDPHAGRPATSGRAACRHHRRGDFPWAMPQWDGRDARSRRPRCRPPGSAR